MKEKSITFRVSDELHKLLLDFGKLKGLDLSSVVRMILTESVKEKNKSTKK